MTENKEQDERQILKKYIPERDYESNDWRPFGKPFDDLCGNCEHYYKKLFNLGATPKEFMPSCSRHILDEFRDLTAEDFDDEDEYTELLINSDPVAWAYNKFGWKARWYQEELLSCTAQKKVVRAGRRSGKTTCVCIITLHTIFTNTDNTVLVIAPYQAQVTKIFDELDKLLNLNPELAGAVKRKTKNPQRLELYNGSKVMGFSSGSKSASKSDKVRGQDANYIVLDEADYLADDDLEAILAILASHPDCKLWASSTPTGAHNKFYSFCKNKSLGFKEFHYISHESPSWTPEAEDYFRNDFEASAFEHEFLAEFGIQEGGVFRNDLIDESLEHYEMPLPRTSEASRIVMGVDWNGEKNGGHIVVTEFFKGKYKILAKHIIRDAEFTQHASVEKIIELDKEYNCDFIYVDEGYGTTQIEMLHKYGMTNRGSGMDKKVVGYSSSKQIEIRDPRTGTKIKKPAKPFMVNVAALQLQAGLLTLPASEDTQIFTNSKEGEEGGKDPGLVQQMRNFIVERVSVLGHPTYSHGDDHTLMAFLLSIVGFILEFSDMRKVTIDRSILYARTVQPEKEHSRTEGEDPEGPVKGMSAAVRQLDAGKRLFSTVNKVPSAFGRPKDLSFIRKEISKGDRRTLNKHFSRSQINRKSNLGSRKSF